MSDPGYAPPPHARPSSDWYLLALVNGGQWGHLAVLVGTKDLAERAGGHFTAQAVDVDLFLFVFLTHEVLLSLGVQWPEGSGQDGRGSGPDQGQVGPESVRLHEHFLFSFHQPPPPSLPLQPKLWLGR